MIPRHHHPIAHLPLVPQSLLRYHRAFECHDTRFRACARLLQALWREDLGLQIGRHVGQSGGSRRIGSLLAKGPAQRGQNFLTPDIAEIARLEVAYQELGAMIDQARLFGNLLSSMPLAFNVFAPLHSDHELAAQILRAILPTIDLAAVIGVAFEHSPGRLDSRLTGDRSAFDVAIVYERTDGARGLIGIEVKYSEDGREHRRTDLSDRYETLATASGLYKEPAHAALRCAPFQQLFREHLLAQASVMRGDYAEAWFVQIAPRLNQPVQNAARHYAGFLAERTSGQTPFVAIDLETVIEAYGWAGETTHAEALWDRYCNFWKIDAVIRAAAAASTASWDKRPSGTVTQVAGNDEGRASAPPALPRPKRAVGATAASAQTTSAQARPRRKAA